MAVPRFKVFLFSLAQVLPKFSLRYVGPVQVTGATCPNVARKMGGSLPYGSRGWFRWRYASAALIVQARPAYRPLGVLSRTLRVQIAVWPFAVLH